MKTQSCSRAQLPWNTAVAMPPTLVAELGAQAVEPTEGGVGFQGDLALCYRTNLQSRIASRVLWKLGNWAYRNEEEVYHAVKSLPWPKRFDPRHTLRVNVSAIGSPLRSLDFITLRIKDAVCDRFLADGTGQSACARAGAWRERRGGQTL